MSDVEPPSQWSGREKFLEDFRIGEVIHHALGRTVLEADNTWFSLLTMNTNQLHFNDHYAQASRHKRQLVNSGFTVALVLGLSVSDMSQNAVANLGWREIRLLEPVFVGDTLYAESKVLSARRSESKPDVGIVTCYTRGLNQRGEIVLDFERSVMVQRRTARSEPAFPQPAVDIDTTSRSLRRLAERDAGPEPLPAHRSGGRLTHFRTDGSPGPGGRTVTKKRGRASEELADETSEVWESALSHQAAVLEKLALWIGLHEACPPDAGVVPPLRDDART